MELPTLVASVIVVSLYVNLGIALYGIFARPSLVKKLLAITILSDTANAFAVLVGYRWPRTGTPQPPVLMNTTNYNESIKYYIEHAVDPLPQALVLTAIVIGLAVTLFIAFVIIQYYRLYGTVNVRKTATSSR
ncbi:MAG: NADH-quinone oxidoreductase subunit K [Staphylothermus sp.]|nr:NADH-quinone oxidoreductase subunit K [Staphylothermus sp.]